MLGGMVIVLALHAMLQTLQLSLYQSLTGFHLYATGHVCSAGVEAYLRSDPGQVVLASLQPAGHMEVSRQAGDGQ
jgi:hypothetical protein